MTPSTTIASNSTVAPGAADCAEARDGATATPAAAVASASHAHLLRASPFARCCVCFNNVIHFPPSITQVHGYLVPEKNYPVLQP
jgi:hypothetical protein